MYRFICIPIPFKDRIFIEVSSNLRDANIVSEPKFYAHSNSDLDFLVNWSLESARQKCWLNVSLASKELCFVFCYIQCIN
jgi:hypothetical protein